MKRNVVSDPICDRCHLGPETVAHALISCPQVKQIWDGSLMLPFLLSKVDLLFGGIVAAVLDTKGLEGLTSFLLHS